MLRAIRSRISCRIFLPVFGNYMKKTFHPYKIGMFAVFLFSIMLSGCSSFQSMEKLNIFSSDTPRSCSEKAGVKGRFSIHYQADGKEGIITWRFRLETGTGLYRHYTAFALGQSHGKN